MQQLRAPFQALYVVNYKLRRLRRIEAENLQNWHSDPNSHNELATGIETRLGETNPQKDRALLIEQTNVPQVVVDRHLQGESQPKLESFFSSNRYMNIIPIYEIDFM